LAFIATILPPPPSAAQGLFRHGVYEPQYDAQTREDVDHCEDLAYRCLRLEVSQAHGGERGDAEVEGVHHVLSLDGGGSGDLLLGDLLGRLESYQHQHGDEQQADQGGGGDRETDDSKQHGHAPVPVRAMRT
jgi:hypothetical protein